MNFYRFILIIFLFPVFLSFSSLAEARSRVEKCGNYDVYLPGYEELQPGGDAKFDKNIGGGSKTFYSAGGGTLPDKFKIYFPPGMHGMNFVLQKGGGSGPVYGNVYIRAELAPDQGNSYTKAPPSPVGGTTVSSSYSANYQDITGKTYRYRMASGSSWPIINYQFVPATEDGMWVYFETDGNVQVGGYSVSYKVIEPGIYNDWASTCFSDFVDEGISEDSAFEDLNFPVVLGNAALTVGAALEMKQAQEAKVIEENTSLQTKYLNDLLKSFGNAKEKMRNIEDFGEGSRPYSTNEDGVLEYMDIKKSSRELRDKAIKDLESRHKRNTSSRWMVSGNEILSGSALLPRDSTLSTEDLARAKEASGMLLDPFPVYDLPKDYNSVTRGQMDNLQKIKRSGLAVPTAVLAGAIAEHAPVNENVERFETSYEKRGLDESLLESKIKDGKTSLQAVHDLFVEERFSNEDWLKDTHLMSKTGLYRELLHSKGFELETGLRDLEKLNMLAIMIAQETLGEVQRKNESLRQQREKAFESMIGD